MLSQFSWNMLDHQKGCPLHSFRKETQHFWSCISFGEECMPVNMGSLLPRPFNKIIKTLCHGQWPRGTEENGQIKVAFLFKKSVVHLEQVLKLCFVPLSNLNPDGGLSRKIHFAWNSNVVWTRKNIVLMLWPG